MKPPFLSPNPPPVLLWLVLHLGTVLALVLTTVWGLSPPALDTDLLGLLPPSSTTYAAAERLLEERSARSFVILAGNEDFHRAREGAEKLYGELVRYTPGRTGPLYFEDLSLGVDETVIAEFFAYLHEYRYTLLDPQSAALLAQDKEGEIAGEALARAYGALTITGLENLDSDPFLLAERELRFFLASPLVNGGGFGADPSGGKGAFLREGVLGAEFEGQRYVLIRGTLSGEGASLGGGGRGVRELYAAAERIAGDGTAGFVFSGFPFHSHESAARAQGEITLLSVLTLTLLFLLFILIFRSPLPALMITFAALSSICLGLSAAFLAFRTVHVLTFVFGASLIGLSVDYSIHFFIQRRRGLGGGEICALLFRGVSLSFVSSAFCFLVFLFAPFGILKQFALFSAAGLLSSYATVFCLFPALGTWYTPPPGKDRRENPGNRKPAPFIPALGAALGAVPRAVPALGLFLAAPALIIALRGPPVVKNDLRSLYTVSPKLLAWERIASSALNYRSGASYFIIAGSSLQETLENEERFLALLNEQAPGTYLGYSLFVPPVKTQEQHYRAASKLLPLAETQYRALGFSPEDAAALGKTLREEYLALGERRALPAAVPAYAARALSGLLLGRIGERWYSVILPLGAEEGSRRTFSSLAARYPWAAFVNKTEDISAELDALTLTMLKLLAAAYGLIVLGVVFYYREAARPLRIAAIPLAAALVSLGVHSLLGLPLSFFSAAAFILVLGLGLDYMFYLTENPPAGEGAAGQGVILSYGTTALSFGALLFSSFPPVRLLALGVFPGLSAAFLCAFLLKGKRRPRRFSAP